MPVAVVTEDNRRFELKSCPDGYVIIRRMTHGEKLHRRSMTRMKVNANRGQRNVEAEVDMLQEQVSLWEFANLIIEHNLTDADGRPLNFKNPVDVKKLDAKIGEEIDTRISDYNNFDEEAEDGHTDQGN